MTDTTARAHTQKALDKSAHALHLARKHMGSDLDCDPCHIDATVAVGAYLDALDPAEVAQNLRWDDVDFDDLRAVMTAVRP